MAISCSVVLTSTNGQTCDYHVITEATYDYTADSYRLIVNMYKDSATYALGASRFTERREYLVPSGAYNRWLTDVVTLAMNTASDTPANISRRMCELYLISNIADFAAGTQV